MLLLFIGCFTSYEDFVYVPDTGICRGYRCRYRYRYRHRYQYRYRYCCEHRLHHDPRVLQQLWAGINVWMKTAGDYRRYLYLFDPAECSPQAVMTNPSMLRQWKHTLLNVGRSNIQQMAESEPIHTLVTLFNHNTDKTYLKVCDRHSRNLKRKQIVAAENFVWL